MSQASLPQNNVQPASRRFAFQSALVKLTLVSLVAAVLCMGLLTLWTSTKTGAFQITAMFAFVNWLAAALGLVLVAMVSDKGSLAVMLAYFGGATLRMAMNLATAVALMLASMNLLTILVALGMNYLPLLAGESGLIGKYLWQQGEADDQASSQAKHNGQHNAQADTQTMAHVTETVA